MEKDQNKRKKRLITILIILIVIVLLLVFVGVLYYKLSHKQTHLLQISDTQLRAQTPNLKNTVDDQYFELTGFGQLEITKDNPYINLINPSENSVYLNFDVIYNDKSLYKTKLIEPGKMEQFNIYSCLDAGEHTITYLINVYDITDQKPLWSGIQQEQEIFIKN